MSLDALIMTAGAFVAVLPYLGFPNSWDTILFLVAGVLIVGLGVIVRRRIAHRIHPSTRSERDEMSTSPAQVHEEEARE
jgi:VIT1/CCC1 family predicted Fe2+/Mn2+ transporter